MWRPAGFVGDVLLDDPGANLDACLEVDIEVHTPEARDAQLYRAMRGLPFLQSLTPTMARALIRKAPWRGASVT